MNVDSCCSTLSGMDMLDTNLIFSVVLLKLMLVAILLP